MAMCLFFLIIMLACTKKWNSRPLPLSQQTEKEMNENNVKKGRSVLAMKVAKKELSNRVPGLEKIPVEALLKMALEQIGEQESYIEELETKVEAFERKSTLRGEIRREALYDAQQTAFFMKLHKRLSKQGDIIRKLYDSRSSLAAEVVQLREQLRHQTDSQ